MHYLVTGGTGFVGQQLIANFLQSNHQITVLGRDRNKILKLFNDKVRAVDSLSKISENEIIENIINLAGEPIANKRWSDKQKEILMGSRVKTTQNIIELISNLKTKPKNLISASAIGFYGRRGDEKLNENSKSGDEFTSKLCNLWESEAKKAKKFGVRVCLARFGIVLGKNGGALSKMLPAFKIGLGGKIASGNQFMSFVHIDDIVAAINFLITNQNLSGAFNFTVPNPVTNQEFSKTLAKNLSRPAFFDMPEFVVKILFGEMGEALLTNGQKVLPEKLLESGYKFKFTNLELTLQNILQTK